MISPITDLRSTQILYGDRSQYYRIYELQYYECGDWCYYGTYTSLEEVRSIEELLNSRGQVTKVFSYMKKRSKDK